MKQFCKIFFDNVEDSTFLESCGLADLITTCYGGRNRLCAEAFAKVRVEDNKGAITSAMITAEECTQRWDTIEHDLLKGQKLQGTLTCKDVYLALEATGVLHKFPLMKAIHDVALKGKPVHSLIEEGIIVMPDDTNMGRSNIVKEKISITSERSILVRGKMELMSPPVFFKELMPTSM